MDPNEILRTMRAQNQGSRRARDWYSIGNLAAGEAEVFIYDVIGESWFGGVTAAQFVSDLRALNATKILLRINSPGGAIADAVAIRTALDEHPAQIETHIDGLAASAAAWVGLNAEKVVIAKGAMMMIHEPFDVAVGDAEMFRKFAAVLDKHGEQIAGMFVEKAGGTLDEWRAQMRDETWFTADEAVDAGLADEVAGEATAENRYDATILNIFRNVPEGLVAPKKRNARRERANTPQAGADPAVVRATLEYQRDVSRRLGVA